VEPRNQGPREAHLEVRQVTGTNLGSNPSYSGSCGNVSWCGRRVDDVERFAKYMQGGCEASGVRLGLGIRG